MSITLLEEDQHTFQSSISLIEEVLDGHEDEKLQAALNVLKETQSLGTFAYDQLDDTIIINQGRLLTEAPYSYTSETFGELRFKQPVDFFPIFTLQLDPNTSTLRAIKSEVDDDRMYRYTMSFIEMLCKPETATRARYIKAGYSIL